jgi:nicotinate phosphoribosyltransferase
MVYAALEESHGGNPLDGQTKVIDDWLDRFPSMPVLLVDTFTSDVALRSLTRQQLEAITTCRIDSGDERVIGRKIIDFWQANGLSAPNLMFTNSLSGEKAVGLKRYFGKQATTLFGIGGGSVNNMGFDPTNDLPGMNIVSKATRANGHGTVKLSDDLGKHMGKTTDVKRYKRLIAEQQPHAIGDIALVAC